MVRLLSIIALIGLTVVAPARAAGQFDGHWIGGSPSVYAGPGKKCPATTAEATVADGKLAGKFAWENNSYPITGTIAPDGTVTGRWGGNAMTGKFAGDHFSGTYNSGLCGAERPVSLDRK